MPAPPRWRAPDGGASPRLRALLDAAAAPDPGTRERVWSAVTTAVAAPAAVAPGAAASAASAAATVSSLKPFALLLALAVASHRDQPAELRARPSTVAPVAAPALPPRPVVAPPRTAAVVARVEAPAPAARPVAPRRIAAPPVALAEAPAVVAAAAAPAESAPVETELDVLQRAMTALDGDPARALALTQEAARSFPAGSLEHEREALAIDALARLGRRDEAAARARAFLDAHPSSTQAPRVAAVERSLRAATNR